MDNDVAFEFLSGGTEISGDITTGFNERDWYRLTLTWSDPDGSGNRDLTLNGINLTTDTDLGVVNTATVTAAEFGADPNTWDGIGIRMTRGTIDNIQLIPEPSAGLLAVLAVPMLCLRRRRR
jgi:hypothetical protein